MKYLLLAAFLISAPIHADQDYNRMARNAFFGLIAGVILVGPTWWVFALATPEGARFMSHVTLFIRGLLTND